MSKLHQIQKAMEMIGLQPGAGAPNAPKSIDEAQRKNLPVLGHTVGTKVV